ncbi:hypothetical protein FRB95_013333 [Tulasnella sp. JGI-2019a]|nr:hypothetical protein FRB95_013333 [Tulasnella sp. JGI-2019a]
MTLKGRNTFITGPLSWGDSIIIDVRNTPAKKETLNDRVATAFKDVILWKEHEDKTTFSSDGIGNPVDMKVCEVPERKDFKGVKGKTYRFSFKVRDEAMGEFQIPAMLGRIKKGDILIKEPLFCPFCISWSHYHDSCMWWKVEGISGSQKRPASQVDHEWLHIKSVKVNYDLKQKPALPDSDSESLAA